MRDKHGKSEREREGGSRRINVATEAAGTRHKDKVIPIADNHAIPCAVRKTCELMRAGMLHQPIC